MRGNVLRYLLALLLVCSALTVGAYLGSMQSEPVRAQAFITPTPEPTLEDTSVPMPTLQPTPELITAVRLATLPNKAEVWRVIDQTARRVLWITFTPSGDVAQTDENLDLTDLMPHP